MQIVLGYIQTIVIDQSCIHTVLILKNDLKSKKHPKAVTDDSRYSVSLAHLQEA